MNSKTQSFEKGALILLTSTMVVKIIGAIFKIPISNLLSDSGFGYFSLAYDLFSPFFALSSVGFPIAAARILAEANGKLGIKNLEKQFLRIGAVFTLAVILAAGFVIFFSGDSKGILCYAALLPSILACFAISAYRGYFEFCRNMIPTAVSDIIQAIFKLVAGYGLAYLILKITGKSYLGAAGAILGISLGTIISWIYIKKIYLKNRSQTAEDDFEFINAKEIVLITLPIAAAALCSCMTNLIDSVTVKPILSIKGTDIDINALYGIRSKAYTLFNFIVSFVSVIGVSAFPIIINALNERNDKKAKSAGLSAMKLSAVLSVPAAFGMFAMAKPIMGLLFSGKLSESLGADVLRIYALSALFAGLAVPLISVIQANKLEKPAFKAVAIGAVLKLVLNILLMVFTSWEIIAAAVSTAFCYFFILIYLIGILISKKIMKLSDFKIYLKPVLPAVISVLSAVGIEKFTNSSLFTALSFLVAGIVYLLIVTAFGIVSKEEIKNCLK